VPSSPRRGLVNGDNAVCSFSAVSLSKSPRSRVRPLGLNAICLRYFNVAGAAAPELGDPSAFNLIPLVFQALDRGQRPQVFGADYPTPDGTGVREYIHVSDLAHAHLAAARGLQAGAPSATYNIGRGEGFSVLEVPRTISEVTGLAVDHEVVARRAGDPAHVVTAVDQIRDGLGFTAVHNLRSMVESARAGWQRRRASQRGLPNSFGPVCGRLGSGRPSISAQPISGCASLCRMLPKRSMRWTGLRLADAARRQLAVVHG